jgi:hypothetical protein
MRSRVLVGVGLAGVILLGACGSKGAPSSSPSVTEQGKAASVTYTPAGANPSVSAKMVCQQEVRDEIASALGVSETRVTKPTWSDHVYSCTYVYPNGSIVISVKELVNADSTTKYFESLAAKLGKKEVIPGLAQGAFLAPNDDVVVRKDYKVLLVDVHGISQQFLPAMTRADVANNIASAIMSCWTGA